MVWSAAVEAVEWMQDLEHQSSSLPRKTTCGRLRRPQGTCQHAFCLTTMFAANEEADTPNVTLVILYSFKDSFG